MHTQRGTHLYITNWRGVEKDLQTEWKKKGIENEEGMGGRGRGRAPAAIFLPAIWRAQRKAGDEYGGSSSHSLISASLHLPPLHSVSLPLPSFPHLAPLLLFPFCCPPILPCLILLSLSLPTLSLLSVHHPSSLCPSLSPSISSLPHSSPA